MREHPEMRAHLVLVLVLAGCSTSVAPTPRPDAQIETDAAATVDAGADAFVELDAYTAPDAYAAPDASLDACALVGPSGCAAGLTCRRALALDGPLVESGPAACVAFGTIGEGDASRPCSPFDDQCSAGLFCDAHTCARYCALDGPACPTLHGSPQRCEANGFGVFRCVP